MKKVALVTGASHGIGLAISKAIEPALETLIIVSENEERLNGARSQFKKTKVISIAANLQNESEIDKLVKRVEEEARTLDILVNNAGIYLPKKFDKTTIEEINKVVDINFRSHVILTRLLLPTIKSGTNPQIINISSCAATAQIYGESIYSASKAAITALSNVLRKELNETGIRVTAIQPWGVNTWNDPNPDAFLRPEDIGDLVRYIIETPPAVQIDLVELSSINQWRGGKPSWIEE